MATKLPKIASDFETSLSAAVSVGGTSFTLNSVTDADGNSLSDGTYCFTLDRDNTSSKEYLVGQLTASTKTVSSVSSVSAQGTLTSNIQKAHRIGTNIIISDHNVLNSIVKILNGTGTLDSGSPIQYDDTATISGANMLATKAYVDSVVNGGTVEYDAQILSGQTAGETVAEGNVVYLKASDSRWYLVDTDTSATYNNVLLGIALGAGTFGNTISGGVQLNGVCPHFTGLTADTDYYASATAGGVTSTPTTPKVRVGQATSTTSMTLDFKGYATPTGAEKDALAGDGGTPSSTNTYQTQYSSRFGIRQMTAGATINGATLPVPVYQNKTDNEFYACDGNDTSALKFLGFAISNGTDGASIDIQYNGVVTGFTGLAEGEKYYVQDTIGTIGTSPGTYEVLVGIAISETELLIQKGKRYAHGSFSQADAGADETTTNTVITTGFRPSKIRIAAFATDSGATWSISSIGTWVNGTYNVVREGNIGGSSINLAVNTSYILHLVSSGGTEIWQGTITSVTDTGFTIAMLQKEASPSTAYVHWEAEGEF